MTDPSFSSTSSGPPAQSQVVSRLGVPQGLSADRLLPWARVKDITGLSRTTTWRLQKVGDFPLPVVISPGRVGWRESEVEAWKASRTHRGAPRPPPSIPPPRAPGEPRQDPHPDSGASDAAPFRLQPQTSRPPPLQRAQRPTPRQMNFDFEPAQGRP